MTDQNASPNPWQPPTPAAEPPTPAPAPLDDLELRNSEEIQGNILAGFNKDHQVFMFLTLPNQDQ